MAGSTEIRNPIRFDLNCDEANQMFLAPAFVSDDLMLSDCVKVLRNVKQCATMYFAGSMNRVIQKNGGCGWTPQGSMSITEREIEVAKHRIQVELCTDEFFDTCLECLLGQGNDITKLDATERGREILNFWIERIQQSLKNDLFDLGWFGDVDSAVEFFAQNDGWIKIIEGDVAALLTPTVGTGSGAPLVAGSSVTILEDLFAAQSEELEETPNTEKCLLVSRSIYNDYMDFLKNNPSCDCSTERLENGIEILRYCGVMLIKCPQWDRIDAALGNPDVHRAILTYNRNLCLATDINGIDTSFSIRYDEDSKLHKIEAFFKLGFNVAHPEMLVYGI